MDEEAFIQNVGRRMRSVYHDPNQDEIEMSKYETASFSGKVLHFKMLIYYSYIYNLKTKSIIP